MAIGAEANDDDNEDDHGVHDAAGDDDVKDVLKCFFAFQYLPVFFMF